jgi:hypothetical protein
MIPFHSATFRLLGFESRLAVAAVSEVESVEHRLGFRLPASVREWYSYENAIDILARHSNDDRPIPVREFAVTEWDGQRLLPFKIENQGVCVWVVMLDGSDDPPVFVDVDSNGAQWNMQAPTFSAYIYACVWDYAFVLGQPGLVQAQNRQLSPEGYSRLQALFSEQPPTFGWPGSTQRRFAGKDHALLIWDSVGEDVWDGEGQADWFVGAHDATSLESALRALWGIDEVGQSFYDCSSIGKSVLQRIKSGEGATDSE